MEVKVTKPQVRKLLEKHGEVTLSLFEQGKDPNHYMTAIMQTTIKDIEELDGRVSEAFKESFGKKKFSMAIWEEKDRFFKHVETGEVVSALEEGIKSFKSHYEEQVANGDIKSSQSFIEPSREDAIENGSVYYEESDEYEEITK